MAQKVTTMSTLSCHDESYLHLNRKGKQGKIFWFKSDVITPVGAVILQALSSLVVYADAAVCCRILFHAVL